MSSKLYLPSVCVRSFLEVLLFLVDLSSIQNILQLDATALGAILHTLLKIVTSSNALLFVDFLNFVVVVASVHQSFENLCCTLSFKCLHRHIIL